MFSGLGSSMDNGYIYISFAPRLCCRATTARQRIINVFVQRVKLKTPQTFRTTVAAIKIKETANFNGSKAKK